MVPLLALLFIALPVAEIAVLIKVGSAIGVLNTIGLLILSAMVGTALVRAQGIATLGRVQDSLARDIFPAKAMFDGICLLAAGFLFLVPGFVSDVIGLLLVLPPVRTLLRRLIWRHLEGRGKTRVWINGEEVTPGPRGPGQTIEGSWREIEGDRLEGKHDDGDRR